MGGGEDTRVAWVTLFVFMCLFPRNHASTSSVPAISAVYDVSRSFPGRSTIACLMENANDTLVTHLVPSHLLNPSFIDREWMKQIEWQVLVEGEEARGAVCQIAGTSFYPVTFPLLSGRARLVPEYLSYTISTGEDLRARLRGGQPLGKVWWQQEPLQSTAGWKQATLDYNGTLIIPSAMLSGSGFYSFVNENNVNDTSILGTLSLQIRDCPAYRYGEDCSAWCPDCLHGGVCHPRTGKCVCNEGLMGRRCETPCQDDMWGRHCTVKIINVPGRQICQPFPAPCRCVPGYTGPRCRKKCAAGAWGANCAQKCLHRCLGDCDFATGECDHQGPSPCSGGNAGLPRLRQAPSVRDIRAERATVEFSRWREDYDDGDFASWNTLSYTIRLWARSSTNHFEKDIIFSNFSQTLTKLTPATRYGVMVMVVVSKDNLTCMADGKGRERVHTVFFTTACPEEISAPVIVRSEKTSDGGVFVGWKPVPLPVGCKVQYYLSIVPEESSVAETHNITLTTTHAEVKGLEGDVVYTITVLAQGTTHPFPAASSSTTLVIPGRTVGQGKVVAAVVASVLVVAMVVVVVQLWRRKRGQRPKVAYAPNS